MKLNKFLSFVVLAFIVPVSVRAADPIKMKIKPQEAIEIVNAINDLDKGIDIEIKQGSEISKIIHKAYEIDGLAREALAQDLTTLKPVAENFEKSRLQIIKGIGGDDGIDPKNKEQIKKFTEQFQVLIDNPIEVTITKVDYKDFLLEHNQGLIVILSELQPIIVQPDPVK